MKEENTIKNTTDIKGKIEIEEKKISIEEPNKEENKIIANNANNETKTHISKSIPENMKMSDNSSNQNEIKNTKVAKATKENEDKVKDSIADSKIQIIKGSQVSPEEGLDQDKGKSTSVIK